MAIFSASASVWRVGRTAAGPRVAPFSRAGALLELAGAASNVLTYRCKTNNKSLAHQLVFLLLLMLMLMLIIICCCGCWLRLRLRLRLLAAAAAAAA
jgi:hypothetical protein